MTNDELKKKIVDALCGNIEYELRDYPIDNYSEVVFDYEKTADALIAAGIGDVKEAELRAEVAESELERYTGLIKPLQDENARLKHRAEVVERALRNALNNDTCYFCNEKIPCRCEHRDWGSDECIKSLLQQAEKELQEKRKDE